MKILQVNDSFIGGGASTVMQQLAEALISKGHEVYFAVGEGSKGRNVFRIPHFEGMAYHMFRRLFFFNVDPISRHYFDEIVSVIQPDVVHCHNLASRISLETIKVASKYQVPCVVSIHDYWPVCLNRTRLKKRWRNQDSDICEELGWDRCARECQWESLKRGPLVRQSMEERKRILLRENVELVAASKCIKKVLLSFGFVPSKIEVIYNGVDTKLFTPSQSATRMVLFVGGQCLELKGVEHFKRAARKIRMQRPNVQFIHVGGKVLSSENFIESFGQINRNEMVDLYQRALCVCVPTLFLEQPMVAIESMACARPVVAYDAGGLPEIVKNGETGFVVKRGDIDELAEKIMLLLDNHSLATTMGANARDRVQRYFTLERMCDKYEKLYSELA